MNGEHTNKMRDTEIILCNKLNKIQEIITLLHKDIHEVLNDYKTMPDWSSITYVSDDYGVPKICKRLEELNSETQEFMTFEELYTDHYYRVLEEYEEKEYKESKKKMIE